MFLTFTIAVAQRLPVTHAVDDSLYYMFADQYYYRLIIFSNELDLEMTKQIIYNYIHNIICQTFLLFLSIEMKTLLHSAKRDRDAEFVYTLHIT